jgi:metallo-beta-lactamase family protein
MSKTKTSIQFLGAAGTVTGSKHLLKTSELNILIDCGLFQGLKSLRLKNWDKLSFNEKEINVILLTHSHLDHCGYIPLIVKNGFKGKIIMTPPSRDLVEIILRDSAKIQEEEARKANEDGYTKHSPAKPLYTEKDVEVALKQFETRKDIEWHKLSENISFRFLKNGHILGSAFIEILCFGEKIVFSGDMGRQKNELLEPPTIIEEADYLIMESTYGDRIHPNRLPIDDLEKIILETLKNKGSLLIPSFAVERAQDIMYLLNVLRESKRIPNVPIYLDSPMAASTTDIFLNYPNWHKLTPTEAQLISKNITIIRDYNDTLKLLKDTQNKIIIAASGMLTGGRILSYMTEYGKDPKNTILIVGYQAEGTRGRALREGLTELKIHGKYYQIKAKVANTDTMSGHADQSEMLEWMKKIKKKPKKIFLVHGESQSLNSFRVKIKDEIGVEVLVPEINDEFKL